MNYSSNNFKDRDLKEVFNEYIDNRRYGRGLRDETIRSTQAVFKTLLKIVPEIKNVSDLTDTSMLAFFKRLQTRERKVGNGLKTKGIKESTKMTYWSRLNTFFNWLIDKGYLQQRKNPISDFKPNEPEYSDDRSLKGPQIEKLIAAIDLHSLNTLTLKRDKMIIYILLFCGIRRGELLGLQVRDINLEKRLITIRGETSKSKFTRDIPIHHSLENHIKDYLQERNTRSYKSEYLLVSNNKDSGLTGHGIKHWVERLRKLSGVRFHLHQFRHTFAVNLANNNSGLAKIKTLLGHKTFKMMTTYLRSVKSEELAQDIYKLGIEKLV